MTAINGFINLYKPADWTSHDCVAKLRRLLNTKKIGHGGTLDPKATGVLPVAVGKATKLLQYLPADKAYQAVVRFGTTTTTDDLEGEIIASQSTIALERETVAAALSQFIGAIAQVPPIYSAIQVEGKRLYHLARQGKSVEVPARPVTIHQIQIDHWQAGEQAEMTLDIHCGPGTYIRSLARDLGEAVGTGATLASLLRSRSGGFDIAQSMTLEALEQALQAGRFEPIAAGEAVQHLPAIALPVDLARRWCMGQKLLVSSRMEGIEAIPKAAEGSAAAPLRVLESQTQAFLGIGAVEIGRPTVAFEGGAMAESESEPTNAKILSCKRVYWSDNESKPNV